MLEKDNAMRDFFVHESSYVDEGAVIGPGTKIWHFCHIQSGAIIGANCSLGQNVNVAEMPNLRPRADGYAIVDITAFVNEVVLHSQALFSNIAGAQ